MADRDLRRRRAAARCDGDWTWQELPDKDWVAENQRSFRPFQVGPFWVHPSHVRDGMPAGLLPIEIDAGMAFGTGTHATTRGCLEMLATLDPAETANAVDVGCGSGILAIGMAKLWQRPVLGGDNDAEAVEVAIENAERNGVAPLCRFVTSIGLSAPELADRAPYDLIVANILAGPLMELSESFARRDRAGGRVLLSGLLVEQADMVLSTYKRRGFAFERSHRPRDRRRRLAHPAAAQALTRSKEKGPATAGPFVLYAYAYATNSGYAARRTFWFAGVTWPVTASNCGMTPSTVSRTAKGMSARHRPRSDSSRSLMR